MKHYFPVFCLAAIVFLGSQPVARGQDHIRHFDRKTMKETEATGSIQEENPSKVIYRSGTAGTAKEISAADIVDILYEVSGSVRMDYRRISSEDKRASDPATKEQERKKILEDALKGYQQILPNLTGEKQKFAHRHVQFKITRLLARTADDDPSQRDAAIDALQQFVKENLDGWQISQSAKLLARLQLAKGDAEGAQKTYQTLAAIPDISLETKQECDLLGAEALILAKKYADAEKRLQVLLKEVPADNPQATRIRVYLSECLGASGKVPEAVAQLEGLIAGSTDKNIKALAYNALGDCYRLNGRNQEALWPYLWVDVIYHQDKQEHIKAVEQLARLFEEQGDKTRAKQYRERLKGMTR